MKHRIAVLERLITQAHFLMHPLRLVSFSRLLLFQALVNYAFYGSFFFFKFSPRLLFLRGIFQCLLILEPVSLKCYYGTPPADSSTLPMQKM